MLTHDTPNILVSNYVAQVKGQLEYSLLLQFEILEKLVTIMIKLIK